VKFKDHRLVGTLMDAQNLSARAVAGRMGWASHTYVNRIRAGRVLSLQPEVATRFAEVLGVKPALLFAPKVSGKSGQTARKQSAA